MDLDALMKAAWFTPTRIGWGLALSFIAQPGTGKSTKTKANAARSGFSFCEMLSPGMRGEGAFGVVPVPREIEVVQTDPATGEAHTRKLMVLDYPMPEWAYRAYCAQRGLVFIDEINTAPPALQPYLLGLVLDGVIGASVLPGGIRRCAAMNDTEDAAGGWDIPPALANRFGWIMWEAPSAARWTDWLLSDMDDEHSAGALDAEKEEQRVLKNWALPWSRARGNVAGFINRRPELLHKQPKPGDPALHKAWPSRRSWEFATRAMASAEVHGLDDVTTDEFVSAFIGVSAAAEFAAYVRESDLPDPEELLDGKASWKHDTRRLDLTMAVLSACAALVQNKDAPKRAARAAALWTIIAPICKEDADVVVPAGRVLCKAKLANFPEAKAVLAKIQPMLKAAGINASDS